MKHLLSLFLPCLFATINAQTLSAQVYVRAGSACNSGCGGSWADAYPSLQEALANYQAKVAALVRKSEKRLIENLALDQDIRGSALVPNLDKDILHQEDLAAVNTDIRARIEDIFQQPK